MAHDQSRPSGSTVWAHAAASGEQRLVCHVGALTAPDLSTVDALARMHVLARRHGHPIRYCHAPPALVELVDLLGLSEVLDVSSGPQPGREAEQGEQPLGAEKGVHGLDLPG
jgi:anti-anti-sigma regulatory factor